MAIVPKASPSSPSNRRRRTSAALPAPAAASSPSASSAPAIALEVITEETGDETPAEIRALVSEEEKKRLRIEGHVKVAGPWGLEEGWWTEDPTRRDYWDVEIAGSGIYRIFRERASGDWFADGCMTESWSLR